MSDKKLRMDAYYYGFDKTGAPEIDLILSAVACAGKSYHHTDQWREEADARPGHTGNTPVEWIQNAAQIAADGNNQASAEITRLQAENERLQRFETAYKEFSDKTDWVRPNVATHELGMHVADILRKRCDDLTSHNQAQADEIKALRGQQVHWVTQPGNGLIRCVSDERYRKFAPSIRARYQPIVVQEDEALRKDADRVDWMHKAYGGHGGEEGFHLSMFIDGASETDDLREMIDAAMAQEQQP